MYRSNLALALTALLAVGGCISRATTKVAPKVVHQTPLSIVVASDAPDKFTIYYRSSEGREEGLASICPTSLYLCAIDTPGEWVVVERNLKVGRQSTQPAN